MFGDPSGMAPEKHKGGGGSGSSGSAEWAAEQISIYIAADGADFDKRMQYGVSDISLLDWAKGLPMINGNGIPQKPSDDEGQNGRGNSNAARARVFEFTQDWNKINKLAYIAEINKLFKYYLDNPSLNGEVYNGNFLFLKCMAHYQTGKNRILLVDAKTIDVPKGTKESVNLFKYSNITDEGLALGKVSIFESALNDGEYEIGWDTYGFDIPIPLKAMSQNPINMPSIMFSTVTNGRNIGTAISYLLHNLPFAFTGDGPFHIGFVGTIKR